MSIKNIMLFSLIFAIHCNTNAMENMNTSTLFKNVMAAEYTMKKTSEYIQHCIKFAEYLENPTDETKNIAQLHDDKLRETKEFQKYMTAMNKAQHDPIFQRYESIRGNRDIALIAYINTEAYKQMKEAELHHELHDTADTTLSLFTCRQKAEETQECQEFYKFDAELNNMQQQLQIDDYPNFFDAGLNNIQRHLQIKEAKINAHQMFSDTVLNIYQAVKTTPAFLQYQAVKKIPKEDKNMPNIIDGIVFKRPEGRLLITGISQNIIGSFLGTVFRSIEGQLLIRAINNEHHVLNNIIHPEKWVTEQKYAPYFPCLSVPNNTISKELEHLQIKVLEFLCNTLETQLLLTKHQLHTQEAESNITLDPNIAEEGYILRNGVMSFALIAAAKEATKPLQINTKNDMIEEEAQSNILNTNDTEKTYNIYNDIALFSENVIKKHRALQETQEYKDHQQAQMTYSHNNKDNAKNMLERCEAKLHALPEYQTWLDAKKQETEDSRQLAFIEQIYQKKSAALIDLAATKKHISKLTKMLQLGKEFTNVLGQEIQDKKQRVDYFNQVLKDGIRQHKNGCVYYCEDYYCKKCAPQNIQLKLSNNNNNNDK